MRRARVRSIRVTSRGVVQYDSLVASDRNRLLHRTSVAKADNLSQPFILHVIKPVKIRKLGTKPNQFVTIIIVRLHKAACWLKPTQYKWTDVDSTHARTLVQPLEHAHTERHTGTLRQKHGLRDKTFHFFSSQYNKVWELHHNMYQNYNCKGTPVIGYRRKQERTSSEKKPHIKIK